MMSKKEKNSKTDNVPELRFPEFINDRNWDEMAVGELYDFKTTNSFSREYLNYEKGDVKNIHYGDIHTKFNTLFDITKELVPFINQDVSIEKIKEESYCVEGDMVFADASEDLNDVGKSIEIVHLNNEKLVSGLHTLLARQRRNRLMVGFGGYLFRSDCVRKQIQREAQGAKVLGISATRISNIKISYPENPKEQQKIASCLSSLDEVIVAHSQKLELLKEHKKGLMQNLFPQEGEKVPKLRFKEFEKDGEWVEKKLGEMTIKVGSGVTPLGGGANYKQEGRPFVRSQNVSWGFFLLDDIAFIDETTHNNSKNTEIELDDVLLNITGASIGRSAVANKLVAGGNVNQHVCIIRTKKEILRPFFLNQFLISELGQKQISSFQAGGNRQGLNFSQIRSLSIPIPPTPIEQQRIFVHLEVLDELVAAHLEKIEQLELHKKGLMQRLFPNMNQ